MGHVRWISVLVATFLAPITYAATAAQADPADDADFSSIVIVTNRTFYPLVVDGYRDKTKVTIDDNLDYWKIRADVYNASGRHIRKLGVVGKADDEWTYFWSEATWNGKKGDGTMARKGQYRITVTAMTDVQNPDGDFVETPVTASRTVTIAGGFKDRRITKERRGADTTSRSHGRGCYTDAAQQVLELACWDGTYAKATWRFRIPGNATDVRKTLFGPSGWDHGGKLIMTGRRIRPRVYLITAKVTKWRQEYFDAVQVRYTTRVRV